MKSRQMDLFDSGGTPAAGKGRKSAATKARPGKKPGKVAARARGATRSGPKDAPAVKAARPKRAPAVAGPESPGVVPALADEVELSAAPGARAGRSRKQDGSNGRVTAETLAGRQREISVSEFFTKNRHLLGFDNPSKALLTTVKEAVDNSLDACEEAGILPEIGRDHTRSTKTRFRVASRTTVPASSRRRSRRSSRSSCTARSFTGLSKSRGQQGIGISAAGIYGQLTTGKPMVITSRTGKGKPAHQISVRSTPRRISRRCSRTTRSSGTSDHGTRVELELAGAHRGGRTSIDAYLEQTIVANPHVGLTYKPAKGEMQQFPRATEALPRETMEIKPHPHGVELGMLMRMLHDARGQKVESARWSTNFSRVSPATAQSGLREGGR